MSFFSSTPETVDEDIEEPGVPAWMQPSQDEIPVAVPLLRELASVPGVSLVLQRADVYSSGVKFVFRLDLKITQHLTAAQAERIKQVATGHSFPFSAGNETDQFRVGMLLPDDTTADSGNQQNSNWEVEPDGPTITISGGGGGGSSRRWTFESEVWLWPLPPEGRAEFHFVCESVGIAEGSIELEMGPLRAAAQQVMRLWKTPSE